MKSDFEFIKFTFPRGTECINIYPVGDVHIGSKEHDNEILDKVIAKVKSDPRGYMAICGDMLDMGIVGSKTNVYDEQLMPNEQKEVLYQKLLPIKNKILAVVPGNHEDRMAKSVGVNPLYDVCCRLGIEDNYRENVAILSVVFENRMHGYRRISYVGIISHGSSKNKHEKFSLRWDGADFFISGHTHSPSYSPHGKMKIDVSNRTVKHIQYKEIVVGSMLNYGGYGLKKEYTPTPPYEVQIITLDGFKKHMKYSSEEMI